MSEAGKLWYDAAAFRFLKFGGVFDFGAIRFGGKVWE